MKFFIDHNLPPRLARAINELCGEDHLVIHLKERFDQSTPDVEWIRTLASEGGWIVITQDRLKKADHEKEAIRRSGLILFNLDKQWAKAEFWDKSHRLVQWWPYIIEQAERISGGAAFRVRWRMGGKATFEQSKL
ncbi:DUF5615 family PIN-like protein [Marinobacterium sp. D7]|uniref:DUF5615 family PIN-like protein n=1 Tax=Marinobacterium ramblicola TaxID=2849041 RepID=UPI001C2DA08D|nr:DUF5615 family PIN-like protein [Marinobacterium ramblicola]MBV1790564.1 DUF5615 family PIN-like protein [Marinobacterium ramblicola]